MPKKCEHLDQIKAGNARLGRVRRMPEDRRYLGAPPPVHDLRACRLLRQLQK